MTRTEVAQIVGKRISGVIVKGCPTPPRAQIFLMFDDGTYYEFYSSVEITCAGGVDRGGRKEVLNYMAGSTSVAFEAWGDNPNKVADQISDAVLDAAPGDQFFPNPKLQAKPVVDNPDLPPEGTLVSDMTDQRMELLDWLKANPNWRGMWVDGKFYPNPNLKKD